MEIAWKGGVSFSVLLEIVRYEAVSVAGGESRSVFRQLPNTDTLTTPNVLLVVGSILMRCLGNLDGPRTVRRKCARVQWLSQYHSPSPTRYFLIRTVNAPELLSDSLQVDWIG